jgi:hypothetical protein
MREKRADIVRLIDDVMSQRNPKLTAVVQIPWLVASWPYERQRWDGPDCDCARCGACEKVGMLS